MKTRGEDDISERKKLYLKRVGDQREHKTLWKLQGIKRPGAESLRDAGCGEMDAGAIGREEYNSANTIVFPNQNFFSGIRSTFARTSKLEHENQKLWNNSFFINSLQHIKKCESSFS